MTKKRQPDAAAEESTDSSGDENPKTEFVNCPHIHKSVQLTAVKKVLRDGGLDKSCVECARTQQPQNTSDSIAVCLKCGHCGCTSTDFDHHEKHAKNRMSEPHDLAIDVQSWTVWCFKCEKEIASNSGKKLQECVEFMRKYKKLMPIESIAEKKPEDTAVIALPYPYVFPGSSNEMKLLDSSDAVGLPRVRGLANLGNTCFFNAVLQCLAQTPCLLNVLKEMQRAGEKFLLPGGKVTLNKDVVELEPLEGNLKALGNNTLTKALIDVLTDLKSGTSEVLVPSELRAQLHRKCPQFAGFAEHDSHELLRQLLETVRTEDLQRYKSGILEALQLDKREQRDQITDAQHLAVRGYGRIAGEQMLRPAKVFQGELISTLECQQCQHTTEHIESFLDLSLPVMADKPVHVRRRTSTSADEGQTVEGGGSFWDREGEAALPAIITVSKYQLKKERKEMRRRRRRPIALKGNLGENEKEEDDGNNGSNEEEEEEEEEPDEKAEEVGESGYSSERPGNGDSACGSPNGDPELSPERASPSGAAAAALSCNSQTLAPRTHVSTNECTLQSCLNQFTAQELLTGNNKVGCDACTRRANHGKESPTVYTNASKQLLVVRPPAVLILHLKRFQVLRFTSRKNSEDVKFPAVLDLAPYCTVKCRQTQTVTPNQKDVRYALYGVVQHSGSMHGGHYVAYVKVRKEVTEDDPRWQFLPKGNLSRLDNCKDLPVLRSEEIERKAVEPPPGKWYYVSDSHVSETGETAVLSSEAYLLFYERIY